MPHSPGLQDYKSSPDLLPPRPVTATFFPSPESDFLFVILDGDRRGFYNVEELWNPELVIYRSASDEDVAEF